MVPAWRRRLARTLPFLGILVAGVPAAMVLTFLLMPLWNWVESDLGIEAVGHSGPSDWCFEAVYAVLVVSATIWLALLIRRRVPRP